MAEKYINFLFKKSYAFIVILLVLTALAGSLLKQLPVETSVESLIMEDDPDLLFYEKYKKQFGEDEFIIIGFAHEKIFSPEFLAEIDAVTKEIEKIDEVKEVISITTVETIQGSEFDFLVESLCQTLPETADEADIIKQRALSTESIKGNLISGDATAGLFLIRTKPHENDETYDARLIENLSRVFRSEHRADAFLTFDNVHTAGWVVTDVNMSSYINRDNMVFMPILYIVIILFLFLILRNLAGVGIGILTISLCLLWTMAWLYLIGGAISPMTAILTPLILALSVSDTIHLLLHFFKQERTHENLPTIIKVSVKHLWRPCFLTSLTTAIGFLSLLVSDIPPIRHFGFAAALGMMSEFFITMTVIPLALYLMRRTSVIIKPYNPLKLTDGSVLSRLCRFVEKRSSLIVSISVILICISVMGVSKIKVETNLVEYFKKDSTVYKDFSFIDTHLNGVNTIEVSLKSKQGNSVFLEPEFLGMVESIETYLKSLPPVETVTSVNSFIKQMNQSFHNEDRRYFLVPDSKAVIAQYLLIYGGDELYNFTDNNYNWTRISARVSEHSSIELKKNINKIEDFIESMPETESLEIRVTGKTYLVNKLIKSIVESQVNSLALAFSIIFVILFIVFKSVKLGALSFIPNFLPILFNLGVMGLLDIPLNTATAIISAVAIGIAVDDTIHYIDTFNSRHQDNGNIQTAATDAIMIKGEPITMTSLILCIGFGVLMFSSFVPTIQFGFLSAVIMISAVVCDLVILPSVLILLKNKF